MPALGGRDIGDPCPVVSGDDLDPARQQDRGPVQPGAVPGTDSVTSPGTELEADGEARRRR